MGWFGGPRPHMCGVHGHRFEARHDEVPNEFAEQAEWRGPAGIVKDILVLQRYVRDVCVRCGKVIERTDEREES